MRPLRAHAGATKHPPGQGKISLGCARGSGPRTSRARRPRDSRDRPGADRRAWSPRACAGSARRRSPSVETPTTVSETPSIATEPFSRGRRASRVAVAPGAGRRRHRDRARATRPSVHVALHDVAVEARRRRASRARGSRARPRAELAERVRSSVSRTASKWSRAALEPRHRQAGAVHRDAVADAHARGDLRGVDRDGRRRPRGSSAATRAHRSTIPVNTTSRSRRSISRCMHRAPLRSKPAARSAGSALRTRCRRAASRGTSP